MNLFFLKRGMWRLLKGVLVKRNVYLFTNIFAMTKYGLIHGGERIYNYFV